MSAFTGWSDAVLAKELLDSINLDTAWPVVEQFSKIVRLSGSPEERKAFEILTGHLDRWGIKYTLHEPECFISWPLGATLVVSHLGLLLWETRYVSASLAFPGLKPSPQE